jgi:rhodanese-related sulfurtransferase
MYQFLILIIVSLLLVGCDFAGRVHSASQHLTESHNTKSYKKEVSEKADEHNKKEKLKKSQKKELQDMDEAVRYFEAKLNFSTDPRSVRSALEKKEKVTVVDVRDEKSYKEGHIPGAINLPYDKHSSFEGLEKEFEGLYKDRFIYVYCYNLYCNLSQKAALKFAKLGYPVKEMKGGFQAWKEKNYKIDK